MTKKLNELDLKPSSEKQVENNFIQGMNILLTYMHSLPENEEKKKLKELLEKNGFR